jgi:hypothetical protein
MIYELIRSSVNYQNVGASSLPLLCVAALAKGVILAGEPRLDQGRA